MSESFDAAWLALREPCDHQSRSAALAARFLAALPEPARSEHALLDLGCGSGSNLRYLAPRLTRPCRILGIDRDPALLALAAEQSPPNIEASFREADLADLANLPPGPWAITASALLDLTSQAWLDALAARCRGIPLLMALSFDGNLAWLPEDPEDERVRQAFLQHQRRDKGFGPALGAAAAAYLAERLAAGGHAVTLARTPWRLGPADAALLAAKLAGIAQVLDDLALLPGLSGWLERRRAQHRAGRLRLEVGHLDLLALPEARR